MVCKRHDRTKGLYCPFFPGAIVRSADGGFSQEEEALQYSNVIKERVVTPRDCTRLSIH